MGQRQDAQQQEQLKFLKRNISLIHLKFLEISRVQRLEISRVHNLKISRRFTLEISRN